MRLRCDVKKQQKNEGNRLKINKEVLNRILDEYNLFYRNTVNTIYEVPYKENPEAFVIYDLVNVDAFLLITDREYLIGAKYRLLLFQGNGKREIFELKEEDYSNLYKYGNDDISFLTDLISTKFDTGSFINEILISQIDSLGDRYSNFEKWFSETTHAFQVWSLASAQSHATKFSEHINKPSKTFADKAYKYTYTDLDFTDIIRMVNNEDFEYALNESLAAYEHNLYLAATSTAGTALENLIVTILNEKEIEFELSSGTELGFLTNQLLKEKIINRKMKQRIMNAASLRNLASHANKGRTIREDARMVYQTIYTLASETYQSLT